MGYTNAWIEEIALLNILMKNFNHFYIFDVCAGVTKRTINPIDSLENRLLIHFQHITTEIASEIRKKVRTKKRRLRGRRRRGQIIYEVTKQR